MSQLIERSAQRAARVSPSFGFPREDLLRMADAGVKVVDCIRNVHAAGSNPVLEALRGGGDFTEWGHYPPDDVYDPASHAQYYFHAHPPDQRNAPDYGHFHTFMRPKGMPAGVRPAEVKNFIPPAGDNAALSHLIAISMTPTGMPVQLFTTNRWVTGETWYKAADVIAMLDRFVIDLDHPSRSLNEWLTAMIVLFRPQIKKLLVGRDRTVMRWQAGTAADAFEDRRLEITSAMDISLIEQIEWLDRKLESGNARRASRASME